MHPNSTLNAELLKFYTVKNFQIVEKCQGAPSFQIIQPFCTVENVT